MHRVLFFVARRVSGIGPLVIIGGNEDKTGENRILSRVATLTRESERSNSLGVVTTASVDGDSAFRTYQRLFAELGVGEVFPLVLDYRDQAGQPRVIKAIEEAGALFFSGGDQLRITSVLGGTPFHQKLLTEHEAGLVVAGTSAGASMMSDTMIVGGDAEETPTRNTVHLATGLGLWLGAVIDQHFSQRGRIGRLLSALAQNPGILGVGIDEDTAIEVASNEERLYVHGSHTVTILDGHDISDTNASESSPGQPLALTHVWLHVLPHGYGFDLKERQPIPQVDKALRRDS